MTSPAIPLVSPARRIPWGYLGALAALTALSWGWSLRVAGAAHHGFPLWARLAMWTTMMVGMMVPPEVPTLLRLAGDPRTERGRAVVNASALLCGYLSVWVVASAALGALDGWLAARGLMTHEMASLSVPLNVAILAAAGVVQLSPWKTACLARCRSIPAELGNVEVGKVSLGKVSLGKVSPLGKVSLGRVSNTFSGLEKVSHEKASNTFAGRWVIPLRSGFRHGLASVSSCGVLMLVLLVVGAMNWVAMAALTGYLIVERLVPAPVAPLLGRVSGLGLLLWAGWFAIGTVAW